MGFHIYATDIDALNNHIAQRCNEINERCTVVTEGITSLAGTVAFKGQGADSIKAYFSEVHQTALGGLGILAGGLQTHFAVYMQSFYTNVDSSDLAHLEEQRLGDSAQFISDVKADVFNLRGQVTAAFAEVSDIMPQAKHLADFDNYLNDCINLAKDTKEHFLTNEQAHLDSLAWLHDLVGDARLFIAACRTSGGMQASAYVPGAVVDFPGARGIWAGGDILQEYYAANEGVIQSAYTDLEARQQVRIDRAAQAREEQGWFQMVIAAATVVVGAIVIVATLGAATPLVAALAIAGFAATTAFQVSNFVEGAQNAYLGARGDITTAAFNPLRDTVFMGNQDLYDATSFVVSMAAAVVAPVGLAASGARAAGQTTMQVVGAGARAGARELLEEGAEELAQQYIIDPAARLMLGDTMAAQYVSAAAGLGVGLAGSVGGGDGPHAHGADAPGTVRGPDGSTRLAMPDIDVPHAPDVAAPDAPHAGGDGGGSHAPAPTGGGHAVGDDGGGAHAPSGGDSGGAHAPAPSAGDSGGSHTPAPSGGDSGGSHTAAPTGGDSGGAHAPAPSAGDSGGSHTPAPTGGDGGTHTAAPSGGDGGGSHAGGDGSASSPTPSAGDSGVHTSTDSGSSHTPAPTGGGDSGAAHAPAPSGGDSGGIAHAAGGDSDSGTHAPSGSDGAGAHAPANGDGAGSSSPTPTPAAGDGGMHTPTDSAGAGGDSVGTADAGGGTHAPAAGDSGGSSQAPSNGDAAGTHVPTSGDSGGIHTPDSPAPHADGTHPGTGSPRADTDSAQPDAGAARPETDSSRADADGARPETGTARPETDSTTPETGSTAPDADGARPNTDGSSPDTGTARPGADAARSEADAARPETDSPRADADAASPDAGSTRPDADAADAARPETGAARPETDSARTDADGARPDTDSASPDTDTTTPDTDGTGSDPAADAASPDAGSAGATGDTTAAGAEGGSQAGAGSRSPEVEEAISRRIAEAVQDGKKLVDDPFGENGKLLPNVVYRTGEFDSYIGITDSEGRLVRMSADDLQQSSAERLSHSRNTPGKLDGDHAGHLIADRFGGSRFLDNLVSQNGREVNLSRYRIIENECARALEAGKPVTFDVVVLYDGSGTRPTGFRVTYTIDGQKKIKTIANNIRESG